MEKVKFIVRFTNKYKKSIFLVFLVFCVLLLTVISFMAVKNYKDSQAILEESVEARMISMALAAKEFIDPEKFLGYNSFEDIDNDPDYPAELAQLRKLANEIGAKYLYALKKVDDKIIFIYDTDTEVDDRYEEYVDPTFVHLKAFEGVQSAAASGANDSFGNFSTGVVPLYYENKLIGVVGADINDDFMEHNSAVQFKNMVWLISIIAVTLIIMAVLLFILLKNIKEMQDKLYRQAHYDKLTDLPNRQYLLEHLENITSDNKKTPFSLFFIDLDNFKKVNDTAGHDAGDALLKNIGNYLANAHVDTKVFRPAAGALNVAARIGGDEFILIAPNLSVAESKKYAEELIDGLHTKVQDRNIEKFNVGFSIGIAIYPMHSENFHVLIKYADIAMYHAKNAGKNAFLIYEDEMKGKEEK